MSQTRKPRIMSISYSEASTVWAVGKGTRKVEEGVKYNLSLLSGPGKQDGQLTEPLPYTIEPLPYSMQSCAHFELMSGSIARDVFGGEETKDPDKEVLQHSKEDFILDLLLPVPMAGCLTLLALQNYNRERKMYNVSRKFLEHYSVLTGSSSDGLCLPEVTHMNRKVNVTEGPDEDKIYIFSSLIVDSENKRAFSSLDTSRSPPGYTKLVFNLDWLEKRPSKYPRERVEEKLIKDNYPAFIDPGKSKIVVRSKLVNILRKYLRQEIHSSDRERLFARRATNVDSTANIKFSYHGPAVTCEIERSDFLKVTISKDYVVALPCPRWPQEAAEWVHRDRIWPPKALVRHVVKIGCHIVPKGDKFNKDPHDFLISFSHCEKLLALSLSIKQKRCYMLFKFLFKYSINRIHRGLTTYHCKTIFFRLCEEVHEDHWSETQPFDFLMRLLLEMETCLENGLMPQYFIPQRNMIHFMTEQTRNAVLKDIQKVKENPVGIFLELTEKHRFCWLSKDVSAASIFIPLLLKPHLPRSIAQQKLLEYVAALLDKGEVGVVLSLLCGIEICDEPPSTETSIYFVEKVVETENGSKCQNLKALLATLYHQFALEIKHDESESRKELMDKSIGIFEEIIQEGNCHAWIISEYYNLLFNLESFGKIINHFAKLIRKDYVCTAWHFFKGGIYTNVDFHNRATVEGSIQVAPEFIVPAFLYVSYKAVSASMSYIRYSSLADIEIEMILTFVKKLMKKLQLWLRDKERVYPEFIDEYAHITLGLGYKHLDDIENYKQHFRAAENFCIPLRQINTDLIYNEPVTVRIHHRLKSPRYRPYKRQSKHARPNIPDLAFRFRDFKLNEYAHY
ncbi:uncharacterized protein LOC123550197 [Mercenaria mercenaria]|uniref:uncharacterized protein LOC123550197 n=1 Tax=Mercenaria mercenaria TaxID=6596 RepID=UPI00234E4117|nr:uncharacterized protein LOC123550197 [Mercenaria mercenaria]